MANAADYEKAVLKLELGAPLTSEERELVKKAAKQAGSLGRRALAALIK
jgi:hypothetical protein